jgi:hypothetical protein
MKRSERERRNQRDHGLQTHAEEGVAVVAEDETTEETTEVIGTTVATEIVTAAAEVTAIQMIGRSEERMTVPMDSRIIRVAEVAIAISVVVVVVVMTEGIATMTETVSVKRRMGMSCFAFHPRL